MGLLDKQNPRATRRSLIVWTILGGVGGFLLGLVMYFCEDKPTWGFFFFAVPFMTIACAVAGGAGHWQIGEELDDDGP